MEYLEIFIRFVTAISVIATTILGKPLEYLKNYKSEKKLRKILNTKELDFVLDKLDDKFQKEFIFPNIKENYFFLQTGIYTNSNSIQSYIDLKNKLGKNYTWENIKSAKGYLVFRNNKLEVRISKFLIIFTNLMLAVALSLLVLCFIMIIYYSSDFNFSSKLDWVEFLSSLSILFCSSIFIIYSIHPMMVAKDIYKNLNR